MKRMITKVIYFDNNATTAVDPEVFKAMEPFLKKLYGNPSSAHKFGGQVAYSVMKAREQVASLLNVSHEEIIFTSCGTESDNSAINSAINSLPKRKKIITTNIEHPAIMNHVQILKSKGYIVKEIPVDTNGNIIMSKLEEEIDENTAVVSIMWANNEIGNIYPVKHIAKMTKQYGAIFHTDAIQVVGKIPLDLKNSNIDMLSISGHKFHAPKGIGALYVKKNTDFYPYIIGGHQEKGNRSGTENVAGIVAIGKASELANKYMEYENKEVKDIRNYFENSIIKSIEDVKINGDIKNRTPNTSNISFGFVEGESILILLDKYGIAASSGSACTSGNLEPSHVIKAMKVPNEFLHGTIRFSISRFNTKSEADIVLEKLVMIIKKLRRLSPIIKRDK